MKKEHDNNTIQILYPDNNNQKDYIKQSERYKKEFNQALQNLYDKQDNIKRQP